MYSPKQTLVKTFIRYLQDTYQAAFDDVQPYEIDFLGSTAAITLEHIANSDALYHDLEHTILVTSVGQEILQAKRVCDGTDSVTAEQWLNLITALLCHDIGYCKGICHQDDCELGRQATGVGENFIFLPFGATDASLSSYHVDRSKRFVQEQFQHASLINVETIQRIIDRTRFPATDRPNQALDLAGLGRSADLIGQFSDRHYLQKLPALFYEFEQTGTNESLGYRQVADVHTSLSDFYHKHVHEYVADAIAYLNHTPTGQEIITELKANVSAALSPALCE